MNTKLIYGASLAALMMSVVPAFAEDEPAALQDVVRVTAPRPTSETEQAVSPDLMPNEGVDVTRLIARTPGAARIGNGELSGQLQYRGLFGERLNLRVDSQRFASGGPNLMDPPFHYAPPGLVDHIVIDRGVSPVSAGPGLAGGADAMFKRINYTDSATATLGYDVTAGVRSVDASENIGGVIGVSTDTWRFNLIGSYESGEDYDFKDGTVGGSEYLRQVLGFSSGVRFGDHELTLDMRRQEAGPAGNPPFPMDIRYMDTDFARIGYNGAFGDLRVIAHIDSVNVDHAMNNYDMRPNPGTMGMRETYTYADTLGGDLSVVFGQFGGELKLGVDGVTVDHDMLITNPMNANFYVAGLPEIQIERFGAFAEWEGSLGPVESQLGLRVDQHSASAGTASVGSALPAAPGMLAMAFNNADTDWDDTTFDAVARFWTPEQNGLSWRATLARKEAAPGYLQRYGWMPLPASGGLADGNIYVGDLGLEAETAWIAEAGFDFHGERAYFRPTIFYRQIDNYIQGVAYDSTPGVIDSMVEMISNMNGDPTPLRFANVDARLYGVDFDFGYDLDGPLRVDGVYSYVRGERRDIDDNLYRVAPPSLTAALTYEAEDWTASFEARGVASQNNVSVTNSEQDSSGYVVLSLYGDWQLNESVHISAGVENLLDQVYRDHLAGYNRNADSDVLVGQRLPGAGRSAFVRIGIVG